MNATFLSKKNLGFIFLGLFLSATSSFALTINVPGDQPSIAAAVSAANSGDIIVLAPGTYAEPSAILINKQLTITSQWHETGDEQFIAQTVLDGMGSDHTMFETVDNLGVNVEISGLTFKRFRYPVIINDSAVIKNNVFTNNARDAVSFESKGFGYVGYNTIEDSTDDGIDFDATEGSFTVEFNTIRNSGEDGIELRLYSGSQPNMTYDIHDNIFSGSTQDGIQLIDYPGDSGRVFNIYNNVFDGNIMAGLGCLANGETLENFVGADLAERVNFHNNTVINNAIGVTGGDNFIALNNIFANNTTAGVKRLRVNSVLAHSIFYNNGTHTSDAITGTGNIFDVDPLYDPVTYQLLAGSPSIDSGVATFTWNGLLVLNLDSSSFVGTAPDLGAKEFGNGGGGGNSAPKVNAGNDQVILHPTDSLALVGQVSDDGLPNPPGTVTTTWSQGDGPGIVTFGDASSLGTTATFPLQGKYQLRLTGDDSDKTASDSVVVRYANAGTGNTVAIQTPGTTFFEAEGYAYLYGSAQKLNDVDASVSLAIQVPDGSGTYAFSEHTLSVTEQNVTFYVWIRGKGFDLNSDSVLVSFMNSPDRQVTLSSDNTYGWFQVPGSFTTPAGIWPLIIKAGEDGVIWDRVAFTTDPSFVPEGNQINTFEARVSASADDAEESAAGKVSLTSADLELVFDGNNQTVGMRFNSMNIPKNATITKAYLQFKVDERNSEATALTIQGQNTDNAAIFTTATRNISSRAKTAAMVSWNPAPWTTVGQASVDQQTTNIAPIIQEIVHRPGWALGNSLAIIISGTGHRTAEAFNGDKAGAPLLHVEYSTETQANQAPVVNAGLDQSISLPNSATLSGTVTDDGLPPNSSLTSTWSKSTGPGAVSFANAQALNTTASFSEAGTYVLRLTADDGNLAAFDEVTITVNAANAANVAPVLATIGDKTVTVGSLLSFTATATDANSGDILTFSFVNAPADATTTSAGAFSWTPSATGTYAFTVKVCDNAATPLCDEELVTVTVNEAGATSTINVRVSGGSDDAEQLVSTGAVALASSDLELTVDGTNQTVGMRFNSIAIPKGAVIQNAYVQFTVDETPSVTETLQVWGQAADNAATFTTAANNISSRPKTAASATWNPAAWPTVGAAGVDQQTPDIKAVIQDIVNRSGWTSGNSLAVIITGDGNGKRVAEAFEGLPSAAPLLHVEFAASGDPGNTAPDVNITAPGTGSTFAAGSSIGFTGTAADTEDGTLTGSLSWTSSIDGNIGTGGSFSKVLTTGTHTITASATDNGGLTGSAQITVTVNPPVGAGSVDIRVNSSSDDAEQVVTTGAMSLASSDLELTLDAANQIVGMRFNLVNIPNGATIDNASIQFTVDQVNTAEVTALTISGQAADNAATFTTASSNISLRPTTAASVLWSPVPGWTTVGLAGPSQKTPDLKTVIQEIVNRSGWVSGNSLVVIVTGSGKRVARAFNGVAAAAPLLHVDYH